MKTGILFDLDGTLLATLDDLHTSTNHVLRELGYPERTLDEVRRFVGNGARRLMEQAVPQGADVDQALAMFQAWYKDHCQIKTRAYEGIPEALEILKAKYPLAIVSNKPDAAVKVLCADYFPGIFARGESSDCPRKPAPDMVYKAMEEIGVENCIYVGDSEVDVITARNANVPCLSVLWGFRDRADMEAEGSTHFCDDTSKLVEALESMVKAVSS